MRICKKGEKPYRNWCMIERKRCPRGYYRDMHGRCIKVKPFCKYRRRTNGCRVPKEPYPKCKGR